MQHMITVNKHIGSSGSLKRGRIFLKCKFKDLNNSDRCKIKVHTQIQKLKPLWYTFILKRSETAQSFSPFKNNIL